MAVSLVMSLMLAAAPVAPVDPFVGMGCPAGTKDVQLPASRRCERFDGTLDGPFTTRANGVITSAGVYMDGLKQGHWYEAEGGKVSVGDYVNGSRSGEWMTYDDKGELVSSETWSAGHRQGAAVEKSGAFREEGAFAGDARAGEWKVTDKDGRLIRVDVYANGKARMVPKVPVKFSPWAVALDANVSFGDGVGSGANLDVAWGFEPQLRVREAGELTGVAGMVGAYFQIEKVARPGCLGTLCDTRVSTGPQLRLELQSGNYDGDPSVKVRSRWYLTATALGGHQEIPDAPLAPGKSGWFYGGRGALGAMGKVPVLNGSVGNVEISVEATRVANAQWELRPAISLGIAY